MSYPGYPPQAGGYPPQPGAYPPQAGGYPPQAGGYPPQAGGYPPQAGGYPPQPGAGGYPAILPAGKASGQQIIICLIYAHTACFFICFIIL